jgi:cytochrome P450
MVVECGLLFLLLCLLFYRYVTKNFDRWEKAGIPYIKGYFPLGSHKELMTQTRHMHDIFRENYERFKTEDFHGMFLFGKPVLVVHNMEMIRHVLVKDFNNFVDRNDSNLNSIFDGGEADQYWAKQLIHLSGDEWKDVRSTFSSIFTSGKLKGMLPFIREVGETLNLELNKFAENGQEFEMKEVFGKFTLDSLASCGFGINPKSFEETSSVFVKNAARMFHSTSLDNFKAFSRVFPYSARLQKILGVNVLKPTETRFFRDVIKNSVKQRRLTGETRNDLVDRMIECMRPEQDQENSESQEQFETDMKFEHGKKIQELDEDIVVSTALNLLTAGYDTTSLTLSFMGYFLSKHPEIQTRLQNEIDQAYENNDGKHLDYQAIQALPYLEMCLLESLRHLTPIGAVLRACTKDYTFPGTNIKLRIDDMLIIPACGIHRDEQYYPEPEKFNPEHFSPEGKRSRSPYSFLAFGQGPRACIGMRFALLETKMAMIEVLYNYTFIYSDKNPDVLEVDPHSIMGYVKGGLHAKIQKRK